MTRLHREESRTRLFVLTEKVKIETIFEYFIIPLSKSGWCVVVVMFLLIKNGILLPLVVYLGTTS